ncbi:MAG: zinc ribbon domain-containing protein [Chloracidobacterium sp.]|uniref:Zinc ribbon domain-containing protein n=1 Tax=Chloracidobacterium validum TaxID=2821543 RepID=A0ABX8B6F2_9BACT|nr:zinc ribbon domain-containing protein [Chloracidobacterium validum]QUW02206.1 zinc ribbon domain-containing protein [Chloracidobacterium validum]
MQDRTYRLPSGFNLPALANDIRHFFLMRDHRVQVVPMGEAVIVQAVRDSTLTTLLGQSSALTVRLQPIGDHLKVEIGTSKWLEKAALGVVGYVLLGPLIVLPIVGAFNQLKLVEDLWAHLDTRLMSPFDSRLQTPVPPPEPSYRSDTPSQPSPEQRCLSCQSPMPANAVFCSRCGQRASVIPYTAEPEATSLTPTCPQCGLVNQMGARFCSGCGYRFP